METPEVIEQKIKNLENQLQKSKQFYQYKLICTSEWSDDMIGGFNIGNAKKVLTLLNEGKKLQYRHEVYGNFNVYMNGNGNRILVKNEDDSELERSPFNEFENCSTVIVYKSPINEDTIMSYIVWDPGNWYLNIK
jgi:hypothetical protein